MAARASDSDALSPAHTFELSAELSVTRGCWCKLFLKCAVSCSAIFVTRAMSSEYSTC